MSWVRRTFVAALAVALLATGCGGDSSDDSSVTTIGLLSAALANTAEASNFRESVSVGTTLKMLGINLSSELDEDNPIMVGEVSPERYHYQINLGALLEGLFEGSLSIGGDFSIEMWSDQERLVMAINFPQQLADAMSDGQAAAMAPGVFFIDLAAIEAESPELLQAIAGTSTPDLATMATSLPGALITIEQTSTDPVTFVGTTTSARLNEAIGADVESLARSQAANWRELHSDLDELTKILIQVFETNPVEVEIELDDRGLLSVLWTREDYSALIRALFDSEGFGVGLSEQERREAEEFAESFELIAERRIAYEPDANLEVPLPPPTDDDRTEEWREFMTESGYLD